MYKYVVFIFLFLNTYVCNKYCDYYDIVAKWAGSVVEMNTPHKRKLPLSLVFFFFIIEIIIIHFFILFFGYCGHQLLLSTQQAV